MDKKELLDNYFEIDPDKLVWEVFLMDFKPAMENNPYLFTRLKFQSEPQERAYGRNLMMTVGNEIGNSFIFTEYTGENREPGVLYLSLDNELIKEKYEFLMDSLSDLKEEGLGKVKGYVVMGRDKENPANNMCFGILNNPIEKLKVNNYDFILGEDGLAKKEVPIYKLKTKCDFLLFQGNIYAFNYKFEKLFKLQSTLKRLKMEAIDRIIFKGGFVNGEEFKRFSINYKSTKTFLELDEKRLEDLERPEVREELGRRFNIETEDTKFLLKSENDSKNLLKHLCMKIIKDADSENLYLANKLAKYEIEENSEEKNK